MAIFMNERGTGELVIKTKQGKVRASEVSEDEMVTLLVNSRWYTGDEKVEMLMKWGFSIAQIYERALPFKIIDEQLEKNECAYILDFLYS